MQFNIKARTIMVGKKLVDLIPELAKRGVIVSSPSQLTNAINGNTQGPKADDIVEYSNEIIKGWEDTYNAR